MNLARVLSPSVAEALWWTVGDDVFPVRGNAVGEGAGSYVAGENAGGPGVTLGQVLEALLNTAKAAPRIEQLEIEYLFQKTKQVIGVESVPFDIDWLGEEEEEEEEEDRHHHYH